MKKINKIVNIALIFMILISVAFLQLAYASERLCLRVPIGVSEARTKNAEDSYTRSRGDESVELRKAIRHDMGNYGRIFSWAIADITKGKTHSRKFYSAKKKITAYLNKIFDILEYGDNVNWEADFRNVYNEFADNVDELVKILFKEMHGKNTMRFQYSIEAMKLSLKSFVGNDEIKDVDLENLFKIVETMEASSFWIKENKLNFKSQETAKHIIGKEGEIYRAFLNLVRNSSEAIRRSIDEEYLKATRERTVGPNQEDFEGIGIINVNIYFDKGYSVIKISDNGPGMPKEALEAFENRTTVYSSKGELGGRGFKASRDIIERNNGTIDVQSEPGKGTTFTITLPVVEKNKPDQSLASGQTTKDAITIALQKIDQEASEQEDKLEKIFLLALEPLKDGKVTIERLNRLFSIKEEQIFALLKEIKKNRVRRALINKDFSTYVQLEQNDSPDSALCNITASFLAVALKELGLSPNIVAIKDFNLEHYCVGLKAEEGFIAIDVASGQIIPDNVGHVAVGLLDEYIKEFKEKAFAKIVLVGGDAIGYISKIISLTAKFDEHRKTELLLILESSRNINTDL
jgi:hypothetical protein